MDSIEFSFPDDDLATAGQHAQELRAALIAAGIAPGDAQLVKARPDTMDLGSIVSIVAQGAEVVKPYVEIAGLSLAVYQMIFRDRTTLKLKTKGGELQIRPGDMSAAQLKVVLTEAFRGSAKR